MKRYGGTHRLCDFIITDEELAAEADEEAWALSVQFLLPIPPPPPPTFHRQSKSGSCGDAQDAWVSSQLFIEQYHLLPLEPHLLPLDKRFNMCCGSTVRTTALHFPQLALQHLIHSTSERFFLPLVTADDDNRVSALSAVFSFLVHSFKKDFKGSSVPSLYDSSGAWQISVVIPNKVRD